MFIAIGVITTLGTLCFILIGFHLGHDLPAGPMPFYGLAALCAVVAPACFILHIRLAASPHEASEIPDNPSQKWIDQKKSDFASFDLSALNVLGWLLFLSAILLVIGGCLIAGFSLENEIEKVGRDQSRGMTKLVALPIFLISIGWFQLGKSLLNRFGLTIYRITQRDQDES